MTWKLANYQRQGINFLSDMSKCLLWSSDTWVTVKIGIEMLKYCKFFNISNCSIVTTANCYEYHISL